MSLDYLRRVLRVRLVGFLLALTGAAACHAQSYILTASPPANPSGGSAAGSKGGGPYGTGPGGYGGKAFSSASSRSECSATGTVNFNYTWSAPTGVNPPTDVIVAITSTATWSGGSGSCADGLGDATQGSAAGQTSTGTHYFILGGGSSVTVPISGAQASAATGAVGQTMVIGSASVLISVAIWPVLITNSGATEDSGGNDNCLIGQVITSTISAGPCTIGNCSWTGEPQLAESVWTDSSNNQYFRLGLLNNWGGYAQPFAQHGWLPQTGTTAGPSVTGFFGVKDLENVVTCTGTAYDPNGNEIGSVNAQRDLIVQAPTVTIVLTPGQSTLTPSSTDPTAVESGSGAKGLAGVGMTFTASTVTPALFTTSQCGQDYADQLWSPNRTVVGDDFSDVYAPGIGEDGPFPFQGATWSESGAQPYLEADTPGQALCQVPYSFDIGDTFEFFFVYVAPQGPTLSFVEDVPIVEYDWTWDTSDSVGSGGSWPPPSGNPARTNETFQPYANWYWTQVLENVGEG